MSSFEPPSNARRTFPVNPSIELDSTKNCYFVTLVDECVIQILSYLRAVDIASCSEVNGSIFTKFRIQTAVKYELQYIYYPLISSLSPSSTSACVSPSTSSTFTSESMNYSTSPIAQVNDADCRCDFLYIKEIKLITTALNYSQSQLTKGFWVSTTWLSNTKKFYEALPLPQIISSEILYSKVGKKSGPNNKKLKIRQRRGSDALPPWPCMNSDIMCCHSNLALSKNAKSKRKLIDKKVWFILRRFYPKGPSFKYPLYGGDSECDICLGHESEAMRVVTEKKSMEMTLRKILFEDLEALLMRKNGIPNHLSKRSRTSSSFSLNSSSLSQLSCLEDSDDESEEDKGLEGDSITSSSYPFESRSLRSLTPNILSPFVSSEDLPTNAAGNMSSSPLPLEFSANNSSNDAVVTSIPAPISSRGPIMLDASCDTRQTEIDICPNYASRKEGIQSSTPSLADNVNVDKSEQLTAAAHPIPKNKNKCRWGKRGNGKAITITLDQFLSLGATTPAAGSCSITSHKIADDAFSARRSNDSFARCSTASTNLQFNQESMGESYDLDAISGGDSFVQLLDEAAAVMNHYSQPAITPLKKITDSSFMDEKVSSSYLDDDLVLALKLQQQFDYDFVMNSANGKNLNTGISSSGSYHSTSTSSPVPLMDEVRFSYLRDQNALAIQQPLTMRQPLLPGVYHIVSREWLKKWRNWLKGDGDTSASAGIAGGSNPNNNSNRKPNNSLPILDCTHFLCHTHGKLIVPPHLDEYLRGYRKSLLSGLREYKGEVVEVLSTDEFETLQNALASATRATTQADFNVRFSLDSVNVSWSVDICYSCDPFNYKHILKVSKNNGRALSSLL